MVFGRLSGILSRKILWSVCHCVAAEQYLAIQCFLLSQSHDRRAARHDSRCSHDCICHFILLSVVQLAGRTFLTKY